MAQQNVPSYLRSTPTVTTPPYVNRPNTQPSVPPQDYLLNGSPGLTQQFTTDYTISPHVWNEIADKMNEMAEENRLIKQAVLSTYERTKGNYLGSRNKILKMTIVKR